MKRKKLFGRKKKKNRGRKKVEVTKHVEDISRENECLSHWESKFLDDFFVAKTQLALQKISFSVQSKICNFFSIFSTILREEKIMYVS